MFFSKKISQISQISARTKRLTDRYSTIQRLCRREEERIYPWKDAGLGLAGYQ
jgi:hypothetical protein